MSETKWVTLTETDGIIVAEMMVQRLKGAEIPAFVLQESVGKSIGLMVGPMSVAYVKVPADRFEEARLLLDVPEKVDEDDIVTCPNCESEIILDENEWKQGWFDCPECAERVSILGDEEGDG